VADLSAFARLVASDHGFCVVSTLRPDGAIQSTLVNAGVLRHPLSDAEVVGFVAVGGAKKVDHLRARPRATAVVRSGPMWAAAEGTVELAGPDDPLHGMAPDRLPNLLRDIFSAAGGTHDDWDAYDRAMAAERRVAVLLTPARTYGVG
jgi:PPOX class probable F420-dependent enzyme